VESKNVFFYLSFFVSEVESCLEEELRNEVVLERKGGTPDPLTSPSTESLFVFSVARLEIYSGLQHFSGLCGVRGTVN
jgi:hypothetical protein